MGSVSPWTRCRRERRYRPPGPAVLLLSGDKPDCVMAVDAVDGRIQSVYIIRNPDKLRSLAR